MARKWRRRLSNRGLAIIALAMGVGAIAAYVVTSSNDPPRSGRGAMPDLTGVLLGEPAGLTVARATGSGLALMSLDKDDMRTFEPNGRVMDVTLSLTADTLATLPVERRLNVPFHRSRYGHALGLRTPDDAFAGVITLAKEATTAAIDLTADAKVDLLLQATRNGVQAGLTTDPRALPAVRAALEGSARFCRANLQRDVADGYAVLLCPRQTLRGSTAPRLTLAGLALSDEEPTDQDGAADTAQPGGTHFASLALQPQRRPSPRLLMVHPEGWGVPVALPPVCPDLRTLRRMAVVLVDFGVPLLREESRRIEDQLENRLQPVNRALGRFAQAASASAGGGPGAGITVGGAVLTTWVDYTTIDLAAKQRALERAVTDALLKLAEARVALGETPPNKRRVIEQLNGAYEDLARGLWFGRDELDAVRRSIFGPEDGVYDWYRGCGHLDHYFSSDVRDAGFLDLRQPPPRFPDRRSAARAAFNENVPAGLGAYEFLPREHRLCRYEPSDADETRASRVRCFHDVPVGRIDAGHITTLNRPGEFHAARMLLLLAPSDVQGFRVIDFEEGLWIDTQVIGSIADIAPSRWPR